MSYLSGASRCEDGKIRDPEPLELAITRPPDGNIGMYVASERGVVRISSVRPNSAAATAGLRAGLHLLSIGGTELSTASQFMHCLPPPGATAAFVVGDLRPPTPPQLPQLPPPRPPQLRPEDGGGLPGDYTMRACCCCCNVVAQVWQRSARTPPWSCVLVAALLWLCFWLCVMRDLFESYVLMFVEIGRGESEASAPPSPPPMPRTSASEIFVGHNISVAGFFFLGAPYAAKPAA